MDRFLWGVATSAYQIEGAIENDWTAWETLGKLNVPGVACGHGSGHSDAPDVDWTALLSSAIMPASWVDPA